MKYATEMNTPFVTNSGLFAVFGRHHGRSDVVHDQYRLAHLAAEGLLRHGHGLVPAGKLCLRHRHSARVRRRPLLHQGSWKLMIIKYISTYSGIDLIVTMSITSQHLTMCNVHIINSISTDRKLQNYHAMKRKIRLISIQSDYHPYPSRCESASDPKTIRRGSQPID